MSTLAIASPPGASPPGMKSSFLEVWLVSTGHALTHWYPATFYLLLPLIGAELGLSYLQIGSILTAQATAGALQYPGRHAGGFGQPQGAADGDLPVLGRRPLFSHGPQPPVLDVARLRSARGRRQQSLAS